jgi:hypothetical protein
MDLDFKATVLGYVAFHGRHRVYLTRLGTQWEVRVDLGAQKLWSTRVDRISYATKAAVDYLERTKNNVVPINTKRIQEVEHFIKDLKENK